MGNTGGGRSFLKKRRGSALNWRGCHRRNCLWKETRGLTRWAGGRTVPKKVVKDLGNERRSDCEGGSESVPGPKSGVRGRKGSCASLRLG